MFLVCSAIFCLTLSCLFITFTYRKLTLPRRIARLGKWAVVTGATDGIGKAFAVRFAKLGLDVVLVSRNRSKLESVARELESEYKVKTVTVQMDFATAVDETYAEAGKVFDELDVGVLVNNVGTSYPHPEYFLNLEKTSGRLYEDIVNCNVISTVNMSRLVMPGMVRRGRGLVINVSSGLARIPAPLLSLYAASKSFVSKLSADLNAEYRSFGVTVKCLEPGYVATALSRQRVNWGTPTPEDYVVSAFGYLASFDTTDGYFPHTLVRVLTSWAYFILPRFISNKVLEHMLSIRKKALRKLETNKMT